MLPLDGVFRSVLDRVSLLIDHHRASAFIGARYGGIGAEPSHHVQTRWYFSHLLVRHSNGRRWWQT